MSESVLVHELIGMGCITACAVTALVVAELLGRFSSLPPELTRKFAHIGSGVAVLLIPVFVSSAWTVFALSAGFVGLMLGTHLMGQLQGVHGVGRGVGGVLWYPTTAWLTYYLVFDVRGGTYIDYAVPILVLACADAMGAVVGKRWGRHRYEVIPGHHRSLEGSTAFVLVALACIAVPLTLGSAHVAPLRALAVGLVVAIIAAAYEAVSVHGIDNVFVPLGTLLFLDRFLDMSWAQLGVQVTVIVLLCGSAVALRWRRPGTGGGAAAFVLACYTVLLLGGWAWLPPMVGLVAAFVLYERLTPMPDHLARSRFELGTAVLGLGVPVVLVLVHAAMRDADLRHAIYVGYLACIGCQGAVLCVLLPQHHAFRFRSIREFVGVRTRTWNCVAVLTVTAWALAGLALAVAVPFVAMRPEAALEAGRGELAGVIAACLAGAALFVGLAAHGRRGATCVECDRAAGPMACGHHFVLAGDGETLVRHRAFDTTYLVANSVAACLAVGAVAWLL